MKKFFFSVLLTLTISISGFGQLNDIANMMAGSRDDAQILLQEYFKPYANAFGANLSGAWFNTAKNHSLLGFDLTLSITGSFIPKVDKSFDARTLGLKADNITGTSSPTMAGVREAGQTLSYNMGGGQSMSYKLPQGVGLGFIPSPMLQLGIGLVKGTDITFRYVPDLTIGKTGEFGLWGVGVKHSIKQYIPAVKMLPFFHLSVFLGYTKMHTAADVNFKPSLYNSAITPNPGYTDPTDGTYDNQRMEMLFTGFTSSVLVSFDLPVVTFYGSAGFASTTANLDLVGKYPLFPADLSGNFEAVENPLSIKVSNSTGTKPRFNGGIKFKMAIITFHVDYTYAKYSLVTAGLGISVR